MWPVEMGIVLGLHYINTNSAAEIIITAVSLVMSVMIDHSRSKFQRQASFPEHTWYGCIIWRNYYKPFLRNCIRRKDTWNLLLWKGISMIFLNRILQLDLSDHHQMDFFSSPHAVLQLTVIGLSPLQHLHFGITYLITFTILTHFHLSRDIKGLFV